MATIVTRSGKGSPLTHTEMDANFDNLNDDKVGWVLAAEGSNATQASSSPAVVTDTVTFSAAAPCGKITLNGADLTANTGYTFTVANAYANASAKNIIVLNHLSGGTFGDLLLQAQPNGTTGFKVNIKNNTSSDITGQTIVLGFAVIYATDNA